jgi:cytochrome P450
MQTINELKLPYLPFEESSFAANPWPHFKAARKEHPWLATCAFGYVVHGYDAIRHLLWQDDHMQGAYNEVVDIMEADGTPWGRFQRESLLAQNGESHRRIRDVLAPAFTPRQANVHRTLMRRVVADLLDEWAPKGAFDFEEFASYFPIGVMCSLIGAPREAIPDLRASMEAFGLSMSMDKAHLPALQKATAVLDDFAQKLVAERRAIDRSGEEKDLLDILLPSVDNGGLSERELYDLLIFLFVAGYDTSKNALTLMMDVLIDRPEIYQRCARDLEFCRKVSEENFRYATTSTIPRVVTSETSYEGVTIPAGTLLFFPISISGRDPVIANGEDFDPERSLDKKHLTFGLGVHMCLGQYIARAQIEEGLHQIARRLANPRRAGPSGWRPFFGVWGLKGLPIEFDPVDAREEVDA